uniref:Peptidase M14 domain-containing protein n=1 Tax=Schlesneria paludicola TaxID=360056 RepID=A0A7C4LN77_9PLAN
MCHHSRRVAPHEIEEGAVRLLSLLTAALCGAIGAACLLSTGTTASSLSRAHQLASYLSPAIELGVAGGTDNRSERAADAALSPVSAQGAARRPSFVELAATPLWSTRSATSILSDPTEGSPSSEKSTLATELAFSSEFSGRTPAAPAHWSLPLEEQQSPRLEERQTAVTDGPATTAGEVSVRRAAVERVAQAAINRQPVGSRTASGWVVVAHSLEGRPIHLKTLGQGGHKTLVVAGLDGEDRIAVNWIDAFVQQLSQAPEWDREFQLLVVRAANPDGLTARHLENARGVALNRNFPTAHYRPGGSPSAGTGPASEPETRALLQLLYEHRPQRVVHLVAAATPGQALCNGVAVDAADALQGVAGLSVEPFDPAQHGGSLEDFATSVLGVEVVSLRLEIGEDWRAAAVANYPQFLAGVIPQSLRREPETARSQPRRHAPAVADDGTDSAQKIAPVTRRSRSGYEELPPPPHKRGF